MGLDRWPDKTLLVETRVLVGDFAGGASVLRKEPHVDDLPGCSLNVQLETRVLQESLQGVGTGCHGSIDSQQGVETGPKLLLYQAQIVFGHPTLHGQRVQLLQRRESSQQTRESQKLIHKRALLSENAISKSAPVR